MKRSRKIPPSKTTMFALLGTIAIISLFSSIILTQPGQISKASIEQKCQDYYNDLQSQLAVIENYHIEKGVKDCRPIQDEMGSTDYSLFVQFKISRDQIGAAKVDKNELEQFSRKLPSKNYSVSIENMQNGDPGICVVSGRYIDNDGKDYPQEGARIGPDAQYVEPGSINGFMPCEDM